jgi:hypothetical protein
MLQDCLRRHPEVLDDVSAAASEGGMKLPEPRAAAQ